MRTKYPIDRNVTYQFEIAIVQIRAMGTDHAGEDNVSRGLLQRLLSPGSFRPSRGQGDHPTASPRASGEENDSIDDDVRESQDNDDDEDYEMEYSPWGRPYAQTPRWFSPVTEPQEAGIRLLMGGEFGRIGVEAQSRKGSASFSKAILSSRSELRPTPRQDIANVRAGYMFEISFAHGPTGRTSSRTPLVRPSRPWQRIYTVANILQVRTRLHLYMLSALPALSRLFLLLHVLQRWASFFPSQFRSDNFARFSLAHI